MNFETLLSLLGELDVRFFEGANDQCCVLFFRNGAVFTLMASIRPGQLLQLVAPSSHSAACLPDRQLRLLLPKLLNLNIKFSVAKVGIDSSDGEIRSMVELPVHEDFCKEELQKAIGAALNMAEEVRDAIAGAGSEAASDESRPPMPPELAALLDNPDAGDLEKPDCEKDGDQSEAA